MLILTRRVNESLMIGDNVAVTVLGVKGNQVRIGIDAPKDVTVHRQEIYDRIREGNLDLSIARAQNESVVVGWRWSPIVPVARYGALHTSVPGPSGRTQGQRNR